MIADDIFEQNLQHFSIANRHGDRAQCKCPAHHDKKASLTVTKGKNCTLVYCHAGCSLESILSSVGLKKQDLFYDSEDKKTGWKAFVEAREKRKIEAVYTYVSCNGEYAFNKIRLTGKKIIYGKLNDNRFTYGLGHNTGRKSYKAVYGSLEALNKAITEGKSIFIPEGEKDVDTLTKQGYVAFTYGGVNDWQKDFAELVKGSNVVILADNDQPGKKVAEKILRDTLPIAKGAKIIVPMPDVPHADISDYFDSHTKEEFEKLINSVTEDRKADSRPELIDLMQFHHVAQNGKITGVYHNAIFEYIKANYNIFVCGSTPYIYENGYYKADITGARLKSIIANKIMAIKLSGLQLSDMEFRVLQESASSYMECRLLNQLADTRTKEGYVIEIGENGEAQQEQRTLRNPYTLLNLPNIEETYKAFGEYEAAVKGLLYSYSGVNAKMAHLLDKPTPSYVSVAMDSYFRNHHEEAFTKVMEKANSILPESKVKRELTENDKKLIDTLIDCKYPSLCKERVKTLAEADATIGSLLELDERYAKFLEE